MTLGDGSVGSAAFEASLAVHQVTSKGSETLQKLSDYLFLAVTKLIGMSSEGRKGFVRRATSLPPTRTLSLIVKNGRSPRKPTSLRPYFFFGSHAGA